MTRTKNFSATYTLNGVEGVDSPSGNAGGERRRHESLDSGTRKASKEGASQLSASKPPYAAGVGGSRKESGVGGTEKRITSGGSSGSRNLSASRTPKQKPEHRPELKFSSADQQRHSHVPNGLSDPSVRPRLASDSLSDCSSSSPSEHDLQRLRMKRDSLKRWVFLYKSHNIIGG